ncbi:hypothetical protein DEJ36_06360 [Curtobacterium sp. MCPF17_052]|nr:hypothetical protein [Curtobacterium sp. MCPF17_052]WIB13424.1 hypothetical protein DEJ36_06360 [Curtobacterium sp. MCPF17_052]
MRTALPAAAAPHRLPEDQDHEEHRGAGRRAVAVEFRRPRDEGTGRGGVAPPEQCAADQCRRGQGPTVQLRGQAEAEGRDRHHGCGPGPRGPGRQPPEPPRRQGDRGASGPEGDPRHDRQGRRCAGVDEQGPTVRPHRGRSGAEEQCHQDGAAVCGEPGAGWDGGGSGVGRGAPVLVVMPVPVLLRPLGR